MPETFQDGFPTNPAEAIEFSYFFSEQEKQEWREWLQTSTVDEQNEMVEMLHKIWLDKQKQVVPDQFNGNMQYGGLDNSTQTPQSNIPNFTPQPDLYAQNQNLNQGFGIPNQNNNFPTQSFDFQNNDQSQTQYQNTFDSNIQNEPLPNFDFDGQIESQNTTNSQSNFTAQTNIPESKESQNTSLIDDDDFDFSFDDPIEEEAVNSDIEPNQVTNQISQAPIKDEVVSEEDDDIFSDFDLNNELSPATPAKESVAPTEPKQNTAPTFSISKIRESATKDELEDLYSNYLNARVSTTSSKVQHDESYDKLMEKVISIVLNFESVADYLEFMTSKLSEMNETIIKQAEKIATFQNGQNNYAHDLKNDIDQLQNKVDGIQKRIDSDFTKYKSQLDNIEISNSSKNDSAYSSHDSLNMQIDLLKSKITKLEKQNFQTNVSSNIKPLSNIPHPPLSTTKTSEKSTTIESSPAE